MAFSTTLVSQNFAGNDAASSFSVSIAVLGADQLKVTKVNPDGAESVLVRGRDYSVTSAGLTGATISLTAGPLPSGYSLTIERDTVAIQEASLRTQGNFPPEAIETALDRVSMSAQETRDRVGRAPSHDEIVSLIESRMAGGYLPQVWGVDGLMVGDGTRTQWSLPGCRSFYSETYIVLVGGVVQVPTRDFVVDGRSQIINFATAVPSGVGIVVWNYAYQRGVFAQAPTERYTTATRPTASAGYAGMRIRIKDLGEAERSQECLQNGDETWSWVTITTGGF